MWAYRNTVVLYCTFTARWEGLLVGSEAKYEECAVAMWLGYIAKMRHLLAKLELMRLSCQR